MTAIPRPAPGIRDAWRELLALACQMRSDWSREDLWAALYACHQAGWEFGLAARETWRLVWDPDGAPQELRSTARDTRPQPRRGPEAYERGARLWRQALEERQGPGSAA